MSIKVILILFGTATVFGIFLWWMIKEVNREARIGGFQKKNE